MKKSGFVKPWMLVLGGLGLVVYSSAKSDEINKIIDRIFPEAGWEIKAKAIEVGSPVFVPLMEKERPGMGAKAQAMIAAMSAKDKTYASCRNAMAAFFGSLSSKEVDYLQGMLK